MIFDHANPPCATAVSSQPRHAFAPHNLLKTLALFLLVATFFAVSASAQTTWTLVWNDEFNGPRNAAPDSSKWTYDTGGGGFGNGELETYCAPTSNTAPCSASNPNIFQ